MAIGWTPQNNPISPTIEDIFNLINAMLVTNEIGGTLTTSGGEDIIWENNAPAGVSEPLNMIIDFTNQTAAETVIVRVYYRITAGGGMIMEDEVAFAGVQDPLLKKVKLEPMRYGIRVTMELTAGVSKDYDWSVVKRS